MSLFVCLILVICVFSNFSLINLARDLAILLILQGTKFLPCIFSVFYFIDFCSHFYYFLSSTYFGYNLFFFFLSFKKKCLFICFQRGEGRERGRETPMCGCLSHTPHQGPDPQPRHSP